VYFIHTDLFKINFSTSFIVNFDLFIGEITKLLLPKDEKCIFSLYFLHLTLVFSKTVHLTALGPVLFNLSGQKP
jgi:hypothetical protein